MQEIGHFVGLGITNMVNVFNPEIVVLGGKVSQSETLFQTAIRTARATAIVRFDEAIAAFGIEEFNDSGLRHRVFPFPHCTVAGPTHGDMTDVQVSGNASASTGLRHSAGASSTEAERHCQ